MSASKTRIQSLDIHKLLQLLNTTSDTAIQVKVFTILAAYLVSNRDEKDKIVKCHNIYETVNSVLNRCLPLKTASALDFVTALVFSDEDMESLTRRHSLAIYARNRIRVSGCLSTMATLFSSCMMYQDTWKSLCRALAETCNGSELNQSYCSHLVPLCVQKCSRGSVDVYLLLQSLLRKHERNIQRFLESKGIALFTREQLENDLCMQLLVIMVQSSRKATLVIKQSSILYCLRELMRTSGKYSKMGQWAKIVLYYIESYTKETPGPANTEANESKTEQKSTSFNQIQSNAEIKDSFKCDLGTEQDTGELFQNIVKELFHSKANFGNLQSAISNIRTQAMNLSMEHIKKHNTIQTAGNIYMQSTKGIDLNKISHEQNSKLKCNTRKLNEAKIQKPKMSSQSFAKYYKVNATKHNETKISDKSKDTFSFSFLLQDSKCGRAIHQMSTNHAFHKYNPKTNITNNLALLNTNKGESNRMNINNNSKYQRQNNNDDDTEVMVESIDLDDFRPISMSTPKSRKDSTNETSFTKYNSALQFSMNQYKHASKVKSNKVRKQKKLAKPTKVKKLTRKSISSRFFNAINDSCTTLVKTVKNIFTTRRDISSHEELTNSHSSNSSVKTCSYSFTNYMRKRDAVLVNDNSTIHESSMIMKDACKTCNDTVMLQRKLKDDDHLKKTIKKLKLGINLYGCDFKKISKNFWPRETYMTPAVLYNLYRKLIVK